MRIGTRVNQIDWWGTFFYGAQLYYTCEVPAAPYYDNWLGTLARCTVWDSRDWYELLPVIL